MIMEDNSTVINDNYNDDTIQTMRDLKRQYDEQVRRERQAYEDQQLRYQMAIQHYISTKGIRSIRNLGKSFIISYEDMMKLCMLLHRTEGITP